jgi:hypothetical protein
MRPREHTTMLANICMRAVTAMPRVKTEQTATVVIAHLYTDGTSVCADTACSGAQHGA